jgi:hypothetical protein
MHPKCTRILQGCTPPEFPNNNTHSYPRNSGASAGCQGACLTRCIEITTSIYREDTDLGPAARKGAPAENKRPPELIESRR